MNAPSITASVNRGRLSVSGEAGRLQGKSRSRRFPSALFILLVLALAVLCAMWLLNPATLPIKRVRIEGNFQHLSAEKMQPLVTGVISGGFFNLNVKAIKEVLLQEPWVYWAVVQRVWPDGISVHVKEQSAAAHWNDMGLLNNSAQIFSPGDAALIGGLPYLSGPEGTQALVLTRYREIQAAINTYGIKISGLNLSDRRAWRIQLQGGPLVILGRNNVEGRISRFTESVLAGLHGEITGIKRIDMRYTNGFAIQWLGDSRDLIKPGTEKHG